MKRSLVLAAAAFGSLALGLGGHVWAQQASPQPAAPASPVQPGPRPPMGGPMMTGQMGGMPMTAGRMTQRMHPGRGGPGGAFGILEFDTNADGKLTKAEFDAALRARFNDLDANKDGSVIPEEMRAYGEKRRSDAEAARFQIMDTDRNGQISKAEYDSANTAQVDRMGPPGGHAAIGMPGPRMAMRGAGPAVPGPQDGRPGQGFGGPQGAPPADANAGPRRMGPMGANSDGKISFEQFAAQPNQAFARADYNRDNVVTVAELQTLTRAMR